MELKGLTMISKNQMLRKQTQNKPKQTQLAGDPNERKCGGNLTCKEFLIL